MYRSVLLPALLALAAGTASAQPALDSIYTSLEEHDCVLLELNEEQGWSRSECPAFAGYRVLLEDADGRQSLSIIDRQGRPHRLDFMRTITGAFSTLGAKLEWRFSRASAEFDPLALIVRVNAADDGSGPRSWLAVIRLSGGDPCVVDRIEPTAQQNLRARSVADGAADRTCRN